MVDLVGFRVRNKDNVLQIDGEYQNLELVSVSTVQLSTIESGLWGAYADVAIPANRENALVAVSKSDLGVYVKKYNANTFRIYAGGQGAQGPVKVFLFAAPLAQTAFGVIGIIVRNPTTGKVVYNSNNRYLRILGFVNVNLIMPIDANAPPSTATFSYPGKTLAVIQCLRPYGRRQTTIGPPNQPVGVFGFFGGTMRVPSVGTALIEHRVIASAIGPRGESTASMTQGVYIIVDVTDY